MTLSKVLKYCPELNALTGSVTSSILMCQLEYWFQKTKLQPFYKFLEPCEDECYKAGDSWTEELGFSRFEFRTAFSKIGKVYHSKTDYLASADPFEGKLYLSYRDRIKKRTYYIRNTQVVDALLLTLDSEPGYSEDYSDNTSTLSNDDYKQVVDLFHQTCPSLPTLSKLASKCKQRIQLLWQELQNRGMNVLETLHRAFKQVEASDFLCGRTSKSSWHAIFEWIVQPEKFFGILQGKYAPFSGSTSSRTHVPTTPPETTAHPVPSHATPSLTLEATANVSLAPTLAPIADVQCSLSPNKPCTKTHDIPPSHTARHTTSPHPVSQHPRSFLRMENHNFDLDYLESRERAHQERLYMDKLHNLPKD